VIDCGIDESKRGGSSLLVVSAMIGQTPNMRKLAVEWRKELANYGVDFFHAKEHWNGHAKPYHGLSMAKRGTLLSRLIRQIHRCVEIGLSVGIDVEEYNKITSSRFRSNWGAPYAFAVQILMVLAYLDLKKRNRLHEDVNVLVEEGPHVLQALEIVGKAKNADDAFIHVVSSGQGSKRDNPILQAGDLLAYGCCQYLATGHSRMYNQLRAHKYPRLAHLVCNADLIESIKRDINASIERKRELRLQERLRFGNRPFGKPIEDESSN